MTIEKLYSASEVSKILKLNLQTVQRFIREERIKAVKVGREYRIKEPDLEDFLNKKELSTDKTLTKTEG